jgi:hypothetical protein
MSEYEALKAYLESLPYYQREAVFSFEQLEKLLGRKLPPSARTQHPWWENDDSGGAHSHAQAWLEAGWKVDEDGISLREEWVRFVRFEKRRWPR